jgi:GTP cyclohydrolase II
MAHSFVGALESFLNNGSSMDVASAQPIATPLTFVAETNLPTSHGLLKVRAYRSSTGAEPLAIIAGDVRGARSVPVRVHDACLTSEALGSLKCDCAQQLSLALKHIAEKGQGIVIYLPQEGRGIGLANKISAYAQQEQGYDTVEANTKLGFPAENRTYEAAAFMLNDLGVDSIALLSNNPHKFESLQKLGVSIDARQPVLVTPNEHSFNYLQVKTSKMGHGLTHININAKLGSNQGEHDLINFRTLYELRD